MIVKNSESFGLNQREVCGDQKAEVKAFMGIIICKTLIVAFIKRVRVKKGHQAPRYGKIAKSFKGA